MPVIYNLTEAWSAAVTPEADETWQARGGPIFLTTNASAAEFDGLQLDDGDAIRVKAGTAVRYRSPNSDNAIAREPIG